jgi:Legionella pneumophila major outer membrane protein precursor
MLFIFLQINIFLSKVEHSYVKYLLNTQGLMKLNTILAITLVSTSVFADAHMSKSSAMPPQDPNPSARYGTDRKSNWFLQGEAVWFKPLNQEIAEYSYAASSTEHNSYSKYFQYNFQPGYRVELGYNTSYDGWDILFQFTGFNYKHNNPFLINNQENDPYLFRIGTVSYKYNFYQGDLDLGRMFKISKHLKARPHVGIRGLWLTQDGFKTYSDQISPFFSGYTDEKKLKGTLIGTEAGVDSIWMIAKQFSIYANAALATLVNSQKLTYNSFNPSSSIASHYHTNHSSRIIFGYDFSIGLRWDMNFSDDKYHLGINLGYEQHCLININSFTEELQGIFVKNGSAGGYSFIERRKVPLISDADFTLQGLAVGARFDF